MKQISKVKLGIGFAVAAFFAILPTNAFAASVKIGTEDITTSGKNAANTATYADGVLTLNGVTADSINIEGVAVTIKTGSKTNSVTAIKSDSALTIDGKVKVSNITVNPKSGVTGDAATPKLKITANAVVDLTNTISVTHRAASKETDAIDIAAKLCAKNGSVEIVKTAAASTSIYKVTGPVNIAASNCDGSKTPGTPDTLDAVYIYVAIFVASSAIFAYRRYLAKR